MKVVIRDILQTTDREKGNDSRYSLSRVSLFIILIILTVILIIEPITSKDYELSIDTLYNLILVFSVYAFGNKGLKHIDHIIDIKSKNKTTSESNNKNKL